MREVGKLVNEELVQNGVVNECPNWSERCDGSIHIQNWWMEQFAAQQSTIGGRIY